MTNRTMLKTILVAAVLAFCPRAGAEDKTDNPPPEERTAGTATGSIRRGDLEVYIKVTGISTAEDAYEVRAPFEGRIEEVNAELFNYVRPENVLAKMVSVEMAAMLDSTSKSDLKQMEKRWKGIFNYNDVSPEYAGIVTEVAIKPRQKVFKGDRLFVIARKVTVVGQNTEIPYSDIELGQTAELEYTKDSSVKLKTTLKKTAPLKGDTPFYRRLWLEVDAIREDIKIGERFNGYLFLGASRNASIVPRKSLIWKNDKKYLVLEVETGLSTDSEIEITKIGKDFLEPEHAATEKENGQKRQTR